MIVAIVPARGGSRGIRRKNLRRVGGQTLVERAINAGRLARSIDRVVLSTDDPAIAEVGRAAGAEVPFLRPPELASDDAGTIDVLRHAVRELERAGATIDLVVTLQPTSPLRTPEEIDRAVALVSGDVDSALTVATLGMPWSVLGFLSANRFRQPPREADVRRQVSPVAARITGSVYVTRRVLLDRGEIIGPNAAALVTNGPSILDIDDDRDLARARRALRRGRMEGGE